MALLSVVLPAYNEEGNIKKATKSIHQIFINAIINHEIIFIDDGSSDHTWKYIDQMAQSEMFIRGIHFSRNFGKEAAINAGLAHARGDCAVVLDCDLQHPPEKMVDMYRLWEQGYEIVEGIKIDRGEESAVHTFAVSQFYKMMSKATNIDMAKASDYKLLDRQAIRALLNISEKQAFFRALSAWIGFKTATVAYAVQERKSGASKWSTKALIRYAVSNITSFTARPLQIVTILGGMMLAVACVFSVVALHQKVAGTALGGFTTVILLNLFMGSVVMISLGIIGHYLAKIYEEVQGRPRYIISKTCGDQKNEK